MEKSGAIRSIMAVHISQIFKGKSKDIKAISSAFNEAKVVSAWNKITSGKIAKSSEPERFSGGVLHLKTKSSVWSNELSSLRGTLIEKLNSAIGEEMVSDIKVKTGIILINLEEKKEQKKKKCGKCGVDFSGNKKTCSFCEREEVEQETKTVYNLLNKMPWSGYAGLNIKSKHVNDDNFYRIKRDMKYRMLDKLITGKNDLPKRKWNETFNHYIQLVIGKKLDEISEKDKKGIKQAVQNKVNNLSRRRKFA